MLLLESLVDRMFSLECELRCAGEGDEIFKLKSLEFSFSVWNCTAHGVSMGCLAGENDMQFVLCYDSLHHERRTFVGKPCTVDASG
jgi:hypothetical protein